MSVSAATASERAIPLAAVGRPPWLEEGPDAARPMPPDLQAGVRAAVEPVWRDMVVHARGTAERTLGLSMVHLVWTELLVQSAQMRAWQEADADAPFSPDPAEVAQSLKIVQTKVKLMMACLRVEQFREKTGRGVLEPDFFVRRPLSPFRPAPPPEEVRPAEPPAAAPPPPPPPASEPSPDSVPASDQTHPAAEAEVERQRPRRPDRPSLLAGVGALGNPKCTILPETAILAAVNSDPCTQQDGSFDTEALYERLAARFGEIASRFGAAAKGHNP